MDLGETVTQESRRSCRKQFLFCVEKEVSEEIHEIRQRAWNMEDDPLEVSAAVSLIVETRAQLASLTESELDQASDSPIIFALPNGMTFEMLPDEFLRDRWESPSGGVHFK